MFVQDSEQCLARTLYPYRLFLLKFSDLERVERRLWADGASPGGVTLV